MCSYSLAAALMVVFATSVISPARADCTNDPRQVGFDKEYVVQIEAYDCRAGGDTFKVEFHQLSEVAASLLVGNRSSALLDRSLGKIKLVENAVSAVYSDLLKRFGVNYRMGPTEI